MKPLNVPKLRGFSENMKNTLINSYSSLSRFGTHSSAPTDIDEIGPTSAGFLGAIRL
jgi:hypothetical protein